MLLRVSWNELHNWIAVMENMKICLHFSNYTQRLLWVHSTLAKKKWGFWHELMPYFHTYSRTFGDGTLHLPRQLLALNYVRMNASASSFNRNKFSSSHSNYWNYYVFLVFSFKLHFFLFPMVLCSISSDTTVHLKCQIGMLMQIKEKISPLSLDSTVVHFNRRNLFWSNKTSKQSKKTNIKKNPERIVQEKGIVRNWH